jgi:hypothetical protein
MASVAAAGVMGSHLLPARAESGSIKTAPYSVGTQLIVLIFRPVYGESPVSLRGAYFRICADATLRGPDNSIAASYCNGMWQLGRRPHRSFECCGPFYLRVTHPEGGNERTGPYDFVKAIDGGLFTHKDYLGAFASPPTYLHSLQLWREVAFLPAD